MNKKSIQYGSDNNRGDDAPLLVIVGPTASGKSALAMQIARDFNGEIICSDSRTIYKGMDIGTAKPSAHDQQEVPHWGLDLVEPGEVFTVADFKKYALKKIAEIRSRGHLPMMVGGSGLYIDGVIFDYQFAKSQPKVREMLESMSIEQLIEHCNNNNVTLPKNHQNKRYVIRAIERKNDTPTGSTQLIDNTVVVGIATNKAELHSRIERRADELFAMGMVEEAIEIGQKYGWKSEAMTGNIYRLVRRYYDGEVNIDELKNLSVIADRQLAKKQLTWFKRNPYIVWKSYDEANEYIKSTISTILNQ